jgi:hypothetical protein
MLNREGELRLGHRFPQAIFTFKSKHGLSFMGRNDAILFLFRHNIKRALSLRSRRPFYKIRIQCYLNEPGVFQHKSFRTHC